MYCGGVGQHGSAPVHDQISAPDALKRAKGWGFATKLKKGSNFTLENWVTANHAGVAALYYSCPADDVATPDGYKALDWKILTPIKDTYRESKRNGVAFSDKMPEWYGFAGGICNWQYDGGVIQTCDDCQLAWGGPETMEAWQAQKPPDGAPRAHPAMRVKIQYQLPADFECKNAVFSWIWQTPHMCLPKEAHEKGAELDFWKFCNRPSFPFRVCPTEWSGEIFRNCIDAEVGGDSLPSVSPTLVPTIAPTALPTTPSPTVPSTITPTPVPTHAGACVPVGDCGSHAWCEQAAYVQWCASAAAGACLEPFCNFMEPTAAPTSMPTMRPPTSFPTASPSIRPTLTPMPMPSPTAAPTPSSPPPTPPSNVCGSCTGCLWSTNQCYTDVDAGYCRAWSSNTWCGGSLSQISATRPVHAEALHKDSRRLRHHQSISAMALIQESILTQRAKHEITTDEL